MNNDLSDGVEAEAIPGNMVNKTKKSFLIKWSFIVCIVLMDVIHLAVSSFHLFSILHHERALRTSKATIFITLGVKKNRGIETRLTGSNLLIKTRICKVTNSRIDLFFIDLFVK
jgi:hypothetical protein